MDNFAFLCFYMYYLLSLNSFLKNFIVTFKKYV